MLVLTRKIGEIITIGDPRSDQPPVEVVVLSVRGELVEIGVEAPKETRIEVKGTVASRRRSRDQVRLPVKIPGS